MKHTFISFALLLLLFVAACGSPEPTPVPDSEPEVADTAVVEESAETSAEEPVAEEPVAEEAMAEEEPMAEEEAMAEEEPVAEETMAEVVSEQVEITLIDPLDGVTNSYCIDIAGGNQDVDPANGLQAHTCYSYQGDLGSDQVFDTAGFANGILYMPVYDVCAQVASASAGAEIGLATCDGSDLQSFVFGDSGTISPAADTSLCFTASSETRFGRSDVHQISDMALDTCSDDLAIYQEWGYRATLEDDITVIGGAHAMSDDAMAEESTETSMEEASTEETASGSFAASAISTLADCDTSNAVAQSTDADVEALRSAIVAFRASLSDDLLEDASVCVTDERVYLWHNTPANEDNRNGITYGELTDEQYALFVALLQAFLSDDGYQKVYEITQLSEGFVSLQRDDLWNPDFYSIDMFGDPENTGSWGFQLDGHHAAINFWVNGDDVSIVPAFMGGEPVEGTYNGEDFDIFSSERDMGLALYAALTADELAAAVSDGVTALVVGPAERNGDPDPYIGDYDYSDFATGLKYSDMSAATQALVTELMQVYVYNLEAPFADTWWETISASIDDTYFVWSGDGDDSASDYPVFYYRFYNPSVWIEYNVETNAGPGVEEGNHGHSIVRVPSTLNGGDYSIFANAINSGPSTLLEHYVMVEHHEASDFNFDYTVAGLEDRGHGHSHD